MAFIFLAAYHTDRLTTDIMPLAHAVIRDAIPSIKQRSYLLYRLIFYEFNPFD